MGNPSSWRVTGDCTAADTSLSPVPSLCVIMDYFQKPGEAQVVVKFKMTETKSDHKSWFFQDSPFEVVCSKIMR